MDTVLSIPAHHAQAGACGARAALGGQPVLEAHAEGRLCEQDSGWGETSKGQHWRGEARKSQRGSTRPPWPSARSGSMGQSWGGRTRKQGTGWTHTNPRPQPPPGAPRPRSSLWVQVRPSQPSRQMQEKESPLPTQVPPFTQGLGRQLLFLAAKESEEESRNRREDSQRSQAGPGSPPQASAQTGPPHRQCRCCPSSLGGKRSGRCPRCRSTCRRCCRCRRHTGTPLRAHGHSEGAWSSGRRPAGSAAPSAAPSVAGRGGHSREWQVLPFQPSSHTQ